jgi:dihydroneopterin triphosphate diphosphatase
MTTRTTIKVPAGRPEAEALPRRKIPESVLVVIHTADLQVLLLERADHPGFWQSVTGSKDHADEPLTETCRREVFEETGIDVAQHRLTDWQHVNRYEIYPHWRRRYGDGVTHNTEHVFGLCVSEPVPVTIAPREHLQYCWLPWEEAAGRCFSHTNVEAIRSLAQRVAVG